MKVIQPPTLRELIADPIYKSYLLRAPKLPAGCRTAEPFRVWGLRHDDKWAGKLLPDYKSAFDLIKKMLAEPAKYRDAVITCRPVGFPPPQGLVMAPGIEWCGHCRRPTVYRRMASHAAMKRWPVVSDEDVRRCYYCAARESSWSRR